MKDLIIHILVILGVFVNIIFTIYKSIVNRKKSRGKIFYTVLYKVRIMYLIILIGIAIESIFLVYNDKVVLNVFLIILVIFSWYEVKAIAFLEGRIDCGIRKIKFCDINKIEIYRLDRGIIRLEIVYKENKKMKMNLKKDEDVGKIENLFKINGIENIKKNRL